MPFVLVPNVTACAGMHQILLRRYAPKYVGALCARYAQTLVIRYAQGAGSVLWILKGLARILESSKRPLKDS